MPLLASGHASLSWDGFVDEVVRPRLPGCESEDGWLRAILREASSSPVIAAWSEKAHSLEAIVPFVTALGGYEGGMATAIARHFLAWRMAGRAGLNLICPSFNGSAPSASRLATLSPLPGRLLPTRRKDDAICLEGLVPAAEDGAWLLGLAATNDGRRVVVCLFETAAVEAVARRPAETTGLQSLRLLASEYSVVPRRCVFYRESTGRDAAMLAVETEIDVRVLSTAVLLGMASAVLEYAIEYARGRETFGRPLWQHQAVAVRIADLVCGLEAARLLLGDVAGRSPSVQQLRAARACWRHASEAALDIGVQGVQLLGGHGYLTRHPVEKWLRDIQTLRVLYA